MVATVRNRRGTIGSVSPHDGPDGRMHLVQVDYNDGDLPAEEILLWEREPFARLLEAAALPDVHADPPMPGDVLTALVRACRWTAHRSYVDPDAEGPVERLPIASPFHGAFLVEDYQLVPLLKALRMPRVSLLIADDVGLGKTVEAGLILSELLLRRRIRRVLILTPASLRAQWKDELWEKFSLPFEIVDRPATAALRRHLGMDANPWRSHSKVIASYHYLKQPDVLEQFRSASRRDANDPQQPWDLLIVDEAHNLSPTPFGEVSEVSAMLREVAPLFEHRLFLTATPHNGYTWSFTGLLEMLDPVRFSQTDELRPAERERVEDVVVRRLKREINARTSPPKFAERLPPAALPIDLAPGERALSAAFAAFRTRVRSLVAEGSRGRSLAGNFALEILGKRLLSCPFAFAESWQRCRAGMSEERTAADAEVRAARSAVVEDRDDDREAASVGRAAAATVGAWLKPLAAGLGAEIDAVERALAGLGLASATFTELAAPTADSRYAALRRLVAERLRTANAWRDDERLVVFTEYKTTLDYLVRRLRADFGGDDRRVLSLYGSMDAPGIVKAAFNDPAHPVRILVATDAASEGINLQDSARYLLHFDVPWNPARLEQRNGRLDRYGQPRDVTVWHFASDDDQDLKFWAHVVAKVDAIREDLGATGEVFDEAIHRRFVEGESLATVQRDLDLRLDAARRLVDLPRDDRSRPDDVAPGAAANLRAIAGELDLAPAALRTTLDVAMGVGSTRPRLGPPDAQGRVPILLPVPAAWRPVIDDTVALAGPGQEGALPSLTFDPKTLLVAAGPRQVFRSRRDTLLVHLSHPLVQQGLTALTRRRYPGSDGAISRWTVRRGPVPAGADALLVVHVEEQAVNDLREDFHHWVRTLRFAVRGGSLGPALPHQPAAATSAAMGTDAQDASERADDARDLWLEVEAEVRRHLATAAAELATRLEAQLAADRDATLAAERARFQSRQAELSALIERSTIQRLEREIAQLRDRARQGLLFGQRQQLDELERDIALRREEVQRRQRHYAELREQLARERTRVIDELVPRRHTLRGAPQVLPLAVEVIFPGESPSP